MPTRAKTESDDDSAAPTDRADAGTAPHQPQSGQTGGFLADFRCRCPAWAT